MNMNMNEMVLYERHLNGRIWVIKTQSSTNNINIDIITISSWFSIIIMNINYNCLINVKRRQLETNLH